MKKAIKNKIQNRGEMIVYQSKDGAIELRGDLIDETIWATQTQIAWLFGVQRPAITKHLKTIFDSKELDKISTCSILEHVLIRDRKYETKYYNLDVIISIGYRINSKTATEFRQWATKTLREHITKGYTINRNQITKNYDAFLKSVEDIQNLIPEHTNLDTKSVIGLIREFSNTWLSLSAYDDGSPSVVGTTKKSVKLTSEELKRAILNLRMELIRRGEATEIFAQEKTAGSIEGIVGNVMQSFNGKDVYKTVEEKAVHLLYFLVKDHPFIDGNKRSGAFAFIWFLRKAKAKKFRNINPSALTALTLLIAESNPNTKDKMIALVSGMLR